MSVSASAIQGNESRGQTFIVGVGNPLLGDEAVGGHIAENLTRINRFVRIMQICILRGKPWKMQK